MSDTSNSIPSTPDATAGVAQSKDGEAEARAPLTKRAHSPGDLWFEISSTVTRQVRVRPYQRRSSDPVYRPLRIFALDPGVSKLEGAVALVNVPYEPLKPGPRGRLFQVALADGDPACDLEDRRVLLTQGFAPGRSDRRFQNQMVYAVCSSVYAAFKAALGRDPAWGFDGEGRDEGFAPGALILRPRAGEERNAHYDKVEGSLNFGWFKADSTANGFMKGESVFTCLSHDVVVHELTHALLDGMRAHFTIPTQVDVLAFHEAFADLVAVFQHFSYREVVLAAIKQSSGAITGDLLTTLARPLAQGSSQERPSALRRAVDSGSPEGKRQRYDPSLEIHDLGSVLLLAVFDAFDVVYRRKVERYMRLATGGAERPSLKQLSPDLQAVLAEEATQLASQFLAVCIRAIDYCPPVDLEFGEFLRAMITADRELVPDDPWGYREALIDAFRERGILPSGVVALDEAALAWDAPEEKLKPVSQLSFSKLRFRGDPGHPAGHRELARQAAALGALFVDSAYAAAFGLERPQERVIDKPRIESIRSARRVGPDGQILFDVVAEISQRRRTAHHGGSGRGLVLHGGSTVILGPSGEIRYVIRKRVTSEERAEGQSAFMRSDRGRQYWESGEEAPQPRRNILKMLHEPTPR